MKKEETLEKLLERASLLFRKKDWKKAKIACYDFRLDKMPYGWVFGITNSWHKWTAKDLTYEFGAYKDPKEAVKAFLIYVKTKKINVKKLME